MDGSERNIVNVGTALSVFATGIFVLQSVGIIPFYIYAVNFYGKTFDIVVVALVMLGLLLPSRGAVELIRK